MYVQDLLTIGGIQVNLWQRFLQHEKYGKVDYWGIKCQAHTQALGKVHEVT